MTLEEHGRKGADALAGQEDDPRFDDLDSRLTAARGQTRRGKPDEPVNPTGKAYRIGLEIVAGTVVGILLGKTFDDWLDTAPWLMIVFVFLGFAAGVRTAIKEAMAMQATEAGLSDCMDDKITDGNTDETGTKP